MDLPEITEAQRIKLDPGDALAIYTDADLLTAEQVRHITDAVRRALGLLGLPVLVLPRGWGAAVLKEVPGDGG